MKNLLLLALIGMAFACGNKPKEEANAPKKPIADIAFQRLNGDSLMLSSLQGKYVLVSTWATWCKPCIAEMPSLAKAQAHFGDRLTIMAASDEDTALIARFVEKRKPALELVQSPNALQVLGITSLPTNVLFNKEGMEIARYVGAREWDSPAMLDSLRQLMK